MAIDTSGTAPVIGTSANDTVSMTGNAAGGIGVNLGDASDFDVLYLLQGTNVFGDIIGTERVFGTSSADALSIISANGALIDLGAGTDALTVTGDSTFVVRNVETVTATGTGNQVVRLNADSRGNTQFSLGDGTGDVVEIDSRLGGAYSVGLTGVEKLTKNSPAIAIDVTLSNAVAASDATSVLFEQADTLRMGQSQIGLGDVTVGRIFGTVGNDSFSARTLSGALIDLGAGADALTVTGDSTFVVRNVETVTATGTGNQVVRLNADSRGNTQFSLGDGTGDVVEIDSRLGGAYSVGLTGVEKLTKNSPAIAIDVTLTNFVTETDKTNVQLAWNDTLRMGYYKAALGDVSVGQILGTEGNDLLTARSLTGVADLGAGNDWMRLDGAGTFRIADVEAVQTKYDVDQTVVVERLSSGSMSVDLGAGGGDRLVFADEVGAVTLTSLVGVETLDVGAGDFVTLTRKDGKTITVGGGVYTVDKLTTPPDPMYVEPAPYGDTVFIEDGASQSLDLGGGYDTVYMQVKEPPIGAVTYLQYAKIANVEHVIGDGWAQTVNISNAHRGDDIVIDLGAGDDYVSCDAGVGPLRMSLTGVEKFWVQKKDDREGVSLTLLNQQNGLHIYLSEQHEDVVNIAAGQNTFGTVDAARLNGTNETDLLTIYDLQADVHLAGGDDRVAWQVLNGDHYGWDVYGGSGADVFNPMAFAVVDEIDYLTTIRDFSSAEGDRICLSDLLGHGASLDGKVRFAGGFEGDVVLQARNDLGSTWHDVVRLRDAQGSALVSTDYNPYVLSEAELSDMTNKWVSGGLLFT